MVGADKARNRLAIRRHDAMMSHLTGVNFTHMTMMMTIGPLASPQPLIMLLDGQNTNFLGHASSSKEP